MEAKKKKEKKERKSAEKFEIGVSVVKVAPIFTVRIGKATHQLTEAQARKLSKELGEAVLDEDDFWKD